MRCAATLKPIRKSAKVQRNYFLALKSWNSLTIRRGSSRRRFKRISLASGHVKGVARKFWILGVSPTNVARPWPFDQLIRKLKSEQTRGSWPCSPRRRSFAERKLPFVTNFGTGESRRYLRAHAYVARDGQVLCIHTPTQTRTHAQNSTTADAAPLHCRTAAQ